MYFKKSVFIFILLIANTLVVPVEAKFNNRQELLLIEAKEAYMISDARIRSVYSEALETVPSYIMSKEEMEKIYKNWVEYRKSFALAEAHLQGKAAVGEEENTKEYWNKMNEISITLIEIIQGWMKIETSTSCWEGKWMDESGGIIYIFEKPDGTFNFRCDVERTSYYHSGVIGGNAAMNHSTARFSIQTSSGPTWLTFIRKNKGQLRLIGDNTSYFTGVRAYFDGTYTRVSSLITDDDCKWIREWDESGVNLTF